ncbi:putative Ankyrin [Seiridium unicorne]|uniref:Ankyrin n=1 Tax=Seiridium unicorne TaxID=138068 RepID=A0ABR2VEQ6_9PEZI
MDFFSLPLELILTILTAAIIARRHNSPGLINRAMRLRLVCKYFNRVFKDALFTTDLLDSYAIDHRIGLLENSSSSYYEIWQQYVAFRTLSPTKELTPNSALLRGTAEAYCRLAGTHDEDSIRECIEALADFRLHYYDEVFFTKQYDFPPSIGDQHQSILVACVYMNNVSVTQRVLSALGPPQQTEPHMCCFTHGKSLFNCPSRIAAMLGRREILRLFLNRHPEPYTQCNMYGVGCGGNLDTFEYIMQFKPPTMIVARDEMPFRVSLNIKPIRLTPDPRVFDRGLDIVKQIWPRTEGWIKERRSVAYTLHHAARDGHVDLLAHLFDLGVPVNPPTSSEASETPFVYEYERLVLLAAARNHHLNVVQLLLEKGVDLHHTVHQPALPIAAAAGSLDIVKVLLDHGADIHAECEAPYERPRPIVSAVLLEHIGMFNFLVERGGLTKAAWDLAMMGAVERDLESMIDLLDNARDDVIQNQG